MPGIRCPGEQGDVELIGFRSVLFTRFVFDEILITSVMDLRRDPARWKALL